MNAGLPTHLRRVVWPLYLVLALTRLEGTAFPDRALQVRGQVPACPSGIVKAVAVSGHYALLAAGELQVVDVRDPANPRFAAWCSTPGVASGLALSGDHAYLADGRAGLTIVNVADPLRPRTVAALSLGSAAEAVAVSGSLAFVAHGGGLTVVDVTDSAQPRSLGEVPIGQAAHGVAVSGQYVFLAAGNAGLMIAEVSNPSAPSLIGRGTVASARGVAVSNGRAYVAADAQGLLVFDVSDPSQPRLMGRGTLADFAYSVTVAGSLALVCAQNGPPFDGRGLSAESVVVFDVSDPGKPARVGSYASPSNAGAFGVFRVGNLGYVAPGGVDGFQIVDLGDLQNPRILGAYRPLGEARVVVKGAHYALVADTSGLHVVDLQEPSLPRPVAWYGTGVRALAARDGFLFLTALNDDGSAFEFHVLDVSAPDGPKRVGRCPGSAFVLSSVVAGDWVYQRDGTGISIIEVKDPSQPKVVGRYSIGEPPDLAIVGDLLFIGVRSRGLRVTRWREDPLLHAVTNAAMVGAEFYGQMLAEHRGHLLTGYAPLREYDVSCPRSLRLLNSLPLPGEPYGTVRLFGDLAACSSTNRFAIWNLQDAEAPELLSLNRISDARDVVVDADAVYVAAGKDGLLILESPPDPAELPPSPDLSLAVTSSWPGYRHGANGPVAMAGTYAFPVMSGSWIGVVDVHDPTQLRQVGGFREATRPGYPAIPVGRIRGLAVDGWALYTASWRTDCPGGEVWVLDISRPTQPRRVGIVPTAGRLRAVAVGQGHLYAADEQQGVLVFDLSEPLNPRQVGVLPIDGKPAALRVAGNRAFVVTAREAAADDTETLHGGDLVVLDLIDPVHPRPLGRLDTGVDASGMATAGHHLLLAARNAGLVVVDISDPSKPSVATTYLGSDSIVAVETQMPHAFVARESAGDFAVEVLDIRDPTLPRPIGSVAAEPTYSLTVRGDYVLAAMGELRSIDFSDPKMPRAIPREQFTNWNATALRPNGDYVVTPFATQLNVYGFDGQQSLVRRGRLLYPGNHTDLAFYGSLAYVADESRGLSIVDFADPANPSLIGQVKDLGKVEGVSVQGHFAYLTVWPSNPSLPSALAVVDLSEPTRPVAVGKVTLTTPGYSGLAAVAARHVFVPLNQDGVAVIDVADPAAPKVVGAFNSGTNIHDVVVQGEYAYLTDVQHFALLVVDIRVPTAPALVGACPLSEAPYAVAVAGRYAYVPLLTQGLALIDLADPSSPRRVGGLSGTLCVNAAVAGGRVYFHAAGDDNAIVAAELEPATRLRMLSAKGVGNRMSLRGKSGQTVRIQRSSALGDWRDWTTVTTSYAPVTLEDPAPPAGSTGFYRVAEP